MKAYAKLGVPGYQPYERLGLWLRTQLRPYLEEVLLSPEGAIHASPALMAIARVADGRIIEVNEAFYQGAGYTRAEVIGRTSLELKIWPNPEHRTAFMARLKEKGHVRDYEAVFYTKTQEARFVSLNADVFEHNGEPCMLMTAIDLTERRRREQVHDATYQISRVLLAGGDLPALFAELHRIIAALLPARNFYVATVGQGDGLIHFPYFVDEFVADAPSRRPGNGLTEHVLETGRTVRAARRQKQSLGIENIGGQRLPPRTGDTELRPLAHGARVRRPLEPA